MFVDYFLKEEDMSATEEMNRLNKQLSEQAEQRLGDKAYLKMLSFREKLPSYKMREVRVIYKCISKYYKPFLITIKQFLFAIKLE